MKLIRLILVFFVITLSGNLMSQEGSINIIAMGYGQNESEAVNNALRNCIERAYGVFITSASSTVNDSLVKDEIYQIGKGAINKYEIINKNENGTEVTVSAYVSPEGVVSYVNSKSSTELKIKGNLFSRNVDKENFYLDQEYQVIKEFIESKKDITFFKIDTIQIRDPYPIGESTGGDFIPKEYRSKGFVTGSILQEWLSPFNYALNAEITIKPNKNYYTFYRELFKLLNSIKLDETSARNLFKYTTSNYNGSKGWTFEIIPNVGFDNYKFIYQKKCPEEPIEPSQLIYNATSYIEPTNEYMDSLIVASFISKKGFGQWWSGDWGFKADWEKKLHEKLTPKLLKAREKKLPISKYPKEYLSRYHTQRRVSLLESTLKENWEKVENEKKDSIREINDNQTMLYLSRLEEYKNCLNKYPERTVFMRNPKSMDLLGAFDIYLCHLQCAENIEIEIGIDSLNYLIFGSTFQPSLRPNLFSQYTPKSYNFSSRLTEMSMINSRFFPLYNNYYFLKSMDNLNSEVSGADYDRAKGQWQVFFGFGEKSLYGSDETWNGLSHYTHLHGKYLQKNMICIMLSSDELKQIEGIKVTYKKKIPPFDLGHN